MLAIRLSRTGKKHQAYFRVVVSDSHRTPTAKFIEILGNYDPHAKKFQINKERTEYYLKNGAQPSNSVAKLLVREKIEMPKWVKITEKKRAPKKVEEKVEAKPATAPAEEPKDQAAEEAPKPEETPAEVTEEAAPEAAEEVKEPEAPAEVNEEDAAK